MLETTAKENLISDYHSSEPRDEEATLHYIDVTINSNCSEERYENKMTYTVIACEDDIEEILDEDGYDVDFDSDLYSSIEDEFRANI
jgi:hypothetical protein